MVSLKKKILGTNSKLQYDTIKIKSLSLSRRRGGMEEERAERQRWNEREHRKIMDSVEGDHESLQNKKRLIKIFCSLCSSG